jgi:hypothetical protein
MNIIQAFCIITILCAGAGDGLFEAECNSRDRVKQASTLYKPINLESNPLRKWTKVIRKQYTAKLEKTTKKD